MLDKKIIKLPTGERVINFSKRTIAFVEEGISLEPCGIRLSEKIVVDYERIHGNKVIIEARQLTEDVEYDILDNPELYRDVFFITDDECGTIYLRGDDSPLIHIVKPTRKSNEFAFDTGNMFTYKI